MDPVTLALIEKIVTTAAALAPTVIQGFKDFEPFAVLIWDSIVKGQAITPEETAAIEAKLADLSNQLQQALPAAQPGDPDYVPPAA